jgi:indolepyruvate ferredoxin oxidoreductase, beta subunit
MKLDVVLSGVGGQGVLTAAAILAETGRREGLTVKQGEVHGMSQRGGAVTANLRMADGPVASDLIPRGSASMILSLEPLEALRWLGYLAPSGIVIASTSPVRNIPDYPEMEQVLAALDHVPHAVVVDADALAREAGSGHANNVVLLGAASPFLPLPEDALKACIADFFELKGTRVVQQNLRAFELGLAAAATPAP